MYKLLWIFFLYAFLGWCAEVVFAAAKTGQFLNRGFLLGPVCPIYSLGVSFVLLLLEPLGDNLFILFVGSVIITSALEFLVGWLAEKALGQRLWDYTDMPFNIKGYICLAFSLMWGIACILVVRVIHPLILHLIGWIPHTPGLVLLAIFSAVFAADLMLTLANAMQLPRQMKAAEDLERLIRSFSDNLGESLYHGVSKLDLDAKLAQYRATMDKNRVYKRWTKAFPHLKKQAHHRRLEAIRAYLEERRTKEEP